MIRQLIQSGFGKTLFAALLAILLAGCGNGGSGGSRTDSSSPAGVTDNVSASQSIAFTPDTGDITLKWTAPVARADGTPLLLTDIKGYVIYYGNSPGDYSNRYEVADGTAQSVALKNIPTGIYYLVMTTYDINNNESEYSAEVRKLVE